MKVENTLVKLCLAETMDAQVEINDEQYCKWLFETMHECPYADITRALKCDYGVVYGCSKEEIKEM
jgi:hypothetical protein